MEQTSAKLFSFNWKDITKGFIMAMLGVIVTGLYTLLSAGQFPADWMAWKPIVMGGVLAGVSYLLKNFFSNSDGQFAKKEVAPNAE